MYEFFLYDSFLKMYESYIGMYEINKVINYVPIIGIFSIYNDR